MLKYLAGATAALSLIMVPVVASAAPANAAAPLSLSNGARTGTSAKDASKFSGGAVYALLIAAGVAAILIIAGTNDNNNDNPDSP
jgi:hypothetical protein